MAQSLNINFDLEEIAVPGYKRVLKVSDSNSGLEAIICMHDLTLGPALGGTRIYPYPTFDAALTDVMRLAKGMTYKSAVAETGLGGGKAVIIADPQKTKTKEKLIAFAHAVNSLEGAFITAEDVGCTVDDVDVMHSVTPYVVGLSHQRSSGNPGPFTAWGIFRGIQAALKQVYGCEDVRGRTVAIQGLGSVGGYLTNLLFWHGAKLIVSDINVEKTATLAKQYGAVFCPPEEIMSVSCDVFAPCALGGVLHTESIKQLNCKAVAGAANNQLLADSHADELRARGILYAPDFVINAGGLINVTQELLPQGYHPSAAQQSVHQIYDQLIKIFELAEKNQISTHAAAVSLADHRIKNNIGKRVVPPCFLSK